MAETAGNQGRARFAIRRPSFDLGQRPFIVIWEITRACDLACAHCRASAMPARNPGELTPEESRSLIDQIAAFGPPAPLFVMTGGDPVKRPDLLDLVSYASSRGLPVSLSPSATPLLTPALVRELRSAGLVALSLSVDGSSSEIHDAFRGIGGVFARTLAAWEAARECGLKVQVNSTVARLNMLDLPRIARLVFDKGAMTWSVFFLVPVGRGIGLRQLSPEQCEDVMNFLYDAGKVLRVKTTEGHHYKRVVLQRMALERRGVPHEEVLKLGPTYRALVEGLQPWPAGPGERRTPIEINAGRGFVFISHLGTVHPSGFLTAEAGNVRKAPLAELYRKSRMFTELRDLTKLQGRCGVCEFARVCGGSRSRAHAMTGNHLAEDPLCAYVPGSFPFPGDIEELVGRRRAEPVGAAMA
jgi:radical SAM protein